MFAAIRQLKAYRIQSQYQIMICFNLVPVSNLVNLAWVEYKCKTDLKFIIKMHILDSFQNAYRTMPMVRLELATFSYTPSALAIELTSSKALAGKELSLSSWCIASLCIYHCSTVVDFSSEKYSGSTGHRNSWYQQRNFQ